MKLLTASLMVISLVGCATSNQPSGPVNHPRVRAISYAQLTEFSNNMSNKNCPRIDETINFLESQLEAKGLLYATPEQLNDEDRKYNATARLTIWGLRIGCNNPNRYRS